jgi:hypothetical protein
MLQIKDGVSAPVVAGYRRIVPILLWLALLTGWLVSIFSVIEELCLATACSDAASFTLFGFGMGKFGIAFFSLILLLLWLRPKNNLLNWVFSALIFSGIGAEFRLLWIQKYIIGGWCPLCVTICCALFIAAVLLLIESVGDTRSGEGRVKNLLGWLVFVMAMSAIGLAVAVVGIKALT